jgi:hypothetical protein
VAGVIGSRIGHRSSGIVCKGTEESLPDKVGVPGWVEPCRLEFLKVRGGLYFTQRRWLRDSFIDQMQGAL